jgi:hypothetical protein
MTFRYRRLSDNLADPLRVGGDMTFGRSDRDFLVDSPTAVAQAVYTRLRLWQGEWFLNLLEGMPWMQQVLVHSAGSGVPDAAIRARILGTPFVTSIEDYSSFWEPTNRLFTVTCKLWTAFGPVTEAPGGGAIMSPSGNLIMPCVPPDEGYKCQPCTPWEDTSEASPVMVALPPPTRALPPPKSE